MLKPHEAELCVNTRVHRPSSGSPAVPSAANCLGGRAGLLTAGIPGWLVADFSLPCRSDVCALRDLSGFLTPSALAVSCLWKFFHAAVLWGKLTQK